MLVYEYQDMTNVNVIVDMGIQLRLEYKKDHQNRRKSKKEKQNSGLNISNIIKENRILALKSIYIVLV